MIREIEKKDKTLFFEMTGEFYESNAVLHPIPREFHENAFSELMRSGDYLKCYIFMQEGKAAGYALLNKMFSHEAGGTVWWTEELYVRPEYRDKGIGSEFFGFMEKHHPGLSYRLEVEPENDRAAALYSRVGYKELPYMQMVKGSLVPENETGD